MKKKFVMTALIAGLLGSTGTVFAASNDQPAPCARPGISGPVDARGYGKGPEARFARQQEMRQNRMKQALDLSDSQEAKMMELRRGFYQESRPVRQVMRNLKRDLALESVKKFPDQRKIANLTQRIGQQGVRMAQLESRHLRKLATVLDARQMDRLLQMKDNVGGKRFNRG
jgi:Spy/CpxP family protein refolding chaperone